MPLIEFGPDDLLTFSDSDSDHRHIVQVVVGTSGKVEDSTVINRPIGTDGLIQIEMHGEDGRNHLLTISQSKGVVSLWVKTLAVQ